MNQATFRTDTTRPVRDLAIAMRKQLRKAVLALKSFVPELLFIALMAVVVMAVKLAHIAVSNSAVANALTSGRLFF